MWEHEKLKAICEKIGYEPNWMYDGYYYEVSDIHWRTSIRDLNVREIIFTPEFMDKYLIYIVNWKSKNMVAHIKLHIFAYLDNPVDYLYDLIK